ncbi:unnamed protein product [Ambrosiozyma monospora]|uniref:Unnamed protein product n=1 Tax=Ambrosiozyma monospora TaxID=43982 RepID=A0A9W6YUE4_AMBMO|nr:unnamed protein product [Ambrosiozyma monospora]
MVVNNAMKQQFKKKFEEVDILTRYTPETPDVIITKNSDSYFAQALPEKKEDSTIPTEQKPKTLESVLPNYGKYAFIKVPFLFIFNLQIMLVCISSSNLGYSSGLLNGLQGLTYWTDYVGNPQGAVLGAINSGAIFGTFLSFVCTSHLCDYLGRKGAILTADALVLIGIAIETAAQNYAMFLIGGIILGIGGGIGMVAAPTLISEISYPAYRQVMTTCFNTCWFLGGFLGAFISYGFRNIDSTWSWRGSCLCACIVPVIQIFAFIIGWIPESPRWLVANGHFEKARAILMKYHANNDPVVGGPLVDFELDEIRINIEAEQLANSYSYWDLFKTPANRKRMFLLISLSSFTQMNGNSVITYYLNKVLDSVGITSIDKKMVVNGWIMFFNYVTAVCVALSKQAD